MGLSKSKPKPSKGEEPRTEPSRGAAHSAPKSRVQLMERQPRDAPQPHSGSHRRGTGAAAPQRPSSSSEEKSDAVKEKSSKKKVVIPQIVITRASTETLASQSSLEMEQRTIREHADWGPYCRHRNPSTADAYNTEARE